MHLLLLFMLLLIGQFSRGPRGAGTLFSPSENYLDVPKRDSDEQDAQEGTYIKIRSEKI